MRKWKAYLCRDHPDDTECVTLAHGPVLQLQVTVGNWTEKTIIIK